MERFKKKDCLVAESASRNHADLTRNAGLNISHTLGKHHKCIITSPLRINKCLIIEIITVGSLCVSHSAHYFYPLIECPGLRAKCIARGPAECLLPANDGISKKTEDS